MNINAMSISAILPAVTWLLIYLAVFEYLIRRKEDAAARKAFLCSVLIFSFAVVVMTESLSAFKLINHRWLTCCWTGIALLLTAQLVTRRQLYVAIRKSMQKDALQALKNNYVKVMVAALLVSLGVALAYPPNNYDSMTYHMARVAHWQQNASIAHYRTHILRQIEFPPFAEWIILHFQVLAGSDRFANSVQLFFAAGCIINVSLLAHLFGAGRRQQLLACVAACFIPMALIQSNTTQNDIVVSFYTLSFVYLMFRLLQRFEWTSIALCGLALGLAWLTKGTGYIFTLGFGGGFLVMIVRDAGRSRRQLIRNLGAYLLIPGFALCINAGQFERNIFFAGSPLGNAGEGTVIEGHDARQIALIAVKNVMNHLPVSHSLKDRVENLAWKLRIDPNDKRYCLVSMNAMAEGFSFHEDYAQNFIHVLVIPLALFLFFKNRASGKQRLPGYGLFLSLLLLTTCLFCSMLQWQPWANRLETPIFYLFAVVIGMEIDSLSRILRSVIMIILIGYGTIGLFLSARHPILPVSNSILSKPYSSFQYSNALLDLAHYIDARPVATIGLYIGSDTYDYPYYKLLSNSGGKRRILKHVFVHNNSTVYLDNFVPDAIISLESSVKAYSLAGKEYVQTGIFGDYCIFELQGGRQ